MMQEALIIVLQSNRYVALNILLADPVFIVMEYYSTPIMQYAMIDK